MSTIYLSHATIIKPLSDHIFIKMIAPEETTNGGIFLPDMAQEKPQVGEITAIGSGKRCKDGSLQELDVSVGDKVLYSQYAGEEIKLKDEAYVLIAEKDVLAIIN